MAAVPLGRAYARLWSATLLSNLGDGIRVAALPLLVASITADPVVVAGVAVAGQLPWLLFGLFAGVIVDRTDQRRLAVLVDAVRAVALAALVVAAATGAVTVALVYVVAFVCGAGETFRDTATATLLPPLVKDADLERANGHLVNAEVAGNELVGPPLGGYLFGVALVLPFAVNGGTLALAAVLILSLPAVFAPRPRDSRQDPPKGRLWSEALAGLRWMARDRRLRALVILGGMFAMVDSAWFAVLVLYVEQVLHLPPVAYGVLLGVGAVGGLAGGFLAARITRLIGSGAALTACLAAAAAGQTMLGAIPSAVAAAAGLMITSGAFGVWAVVARTLRQRITPRELLGRVSSASMTLMMVAAPLGALGGGLVAAGFGLRAPILLGVPFLAVGAFAAFAVFRRSG